MNQQVAILKESSNKKSIRSRDYNYNFNKQTGHFVRWGNTFEDNPIKSYLGPEIADIEISTICNGVEAPCKFCYKSNTAKGEYMALETFKTIFSKFPKTLTQIAFGIGNLHNPQDGIYGNPFTYDIFQHCRDNGVIPNVTINGTGLTDYHVEKLSSLCGAISVSRYFPKDVCYNAIKKLTDAGMTQVNIHQLVSEQTFNECLETISDMTTDDRLSKMNAVVFLSLKPKGKRNDLTVLKDEAKYKLLIETALNSKVNLGFDSCSSPKFLKAIKETPLFKKYSDFAESCEANLFSIYINTKGITYPCSFIEGQPGYAGIDMTKIDDFMKDVWYAKDTKEWRTKLLKTNEKCSDLGNDCRMCPEFDIY